MSTTYPQYQYSNMPDAIDVWEDSVDVTTDMMPIVAQYKQLYAAGDRAGCNALKTQYPYLSKMMVDASLLNNMKHAIMAIEKMYFDQKDAARVVTSKTEPADMVAGDTWVDTSGEYAVYKVKNTDGTYTSITFSPGGTITADIAALETSVAAAQSKADSAYSVASTAQASANTAQGAADSKEPAFTKNSAFNKNFGSAAGTVCQGNDARLSNARRASNISMSTDGRLWISYS